MTELSAKAREGKLGPADMQGGCFSISSLGGIGGTVLHADHQCAGSAILGVCRSSTRPVWDGKQFVPRLILPLSLSYDHRVIDGASPRASTLPHRTARRSAARDACKGQDDHGVRIEDHQRSAQAA